MSTALLPQAFWFRLAIPCQRIDELPRLEAKRLLDLPESFKIPQSSILDGREAWAEVRAAWNRKGLAVSIQAEGDLMGLRNDDRPEGAYGATILVDTRDTRDVSRATRFCHRFDAKLVWSAKTSDLGVIVEQQPIARAVTDPPMAGLKTITSRAERTKTYWRLEMFFDAAALNGFDPETNRRLGFCYRIFDPDRLDEILGVGREFPVSENPSLWSTLELREPERS